MAQYCLVRALRRQRPRSQNPISSSRIFPPDALDKSRRMKRYALYSATLVLLILVGIQFIPVQRTNRLGTGDPQAPRNVQWILRRACYDCHSTETRWPIWAYVAPLSWQVVADVDKARKFLNFSDWASYDSVTQRALRMNIDGVTATHQMP